MGFMISILYGTPKGNSSEINPATKRLDECPLDSGGAQTVEAGWGAIGLGSLNRKARVRILRGAADCFPVDQVGGAFEDIG